ncbi:unnamed protein product [Rotaria sordida]|uniref:RING-type domain-containing protein n=1 Tax=Rotaria sordida TaxID=392033 RepID=A0A819GG09_9BILA|nr:unnamed protein product [Rotaria sordida]CAF3881125.1 unnamed protein product [Rotaria sordida]
MNKIAYSYVDEHLISPSLICPICLDILEDPHTHTPCDSAFCRSCILQLAEPLCPICRWTWDDTIPLQYNIYLPKANRLIRNMLDDLLVQCIYCHTIRRRGQFEHECQPIEERLVREHIQIIPRKKLVQYQMILSILGIVLFLLCIYYYRKYVFEKVIDRRSEIIKDIGYNIDYFLLETIYCLIRKIVEYSMTVFIINIGFWFSIICFGDRIISKRNNRMLKNLLEISIIVNLIIYSISN